MELFDLTNPQLNILLTEQLYSNTAISNISGTAKINEKIDFSLLAESVNYIIKNNDALRIKIKSDNGIYKQYFSEYQRYDVELIEVKNEEELEQLINKLVSIPFKVLDNLLFKFTMFKFPNGTGGCNIIHSHLISDAWSSTLICNQLIDNYSKLLNKEKIQENTQYSYINYIKDEEEYKKSIRFQKDKEYWQEKFNQKPELIAVSKNNNIGIQSEANRLEITLNNTKEIKIYCENNNISTYAFFLVIYSIYISKINKIKKFTIGTPVLNRKNISEKNTLGMYVSTIPLKINIKEKSTVNELAQYISKEILSAFRHQKYPYIELLKYLREKLNFSTGLYDIIISYQNAKTTSNTSNIKFSSKWDFNKNISESLNIHISDLDSTDKLNIYYDYQLNKFSSQEINNIHNRVLFIIEQILNDSNICIDDIDIVPKKEKEKILNINKQFTNYPINKTVVDLFEEQVEKTPNNIAVTINDKKITYLELNNKANRLANHLKNRGITQESVVGIRINKCIEMIIGILAIIKAGGAYLPIDLSYPKDRVEFMLKDSKAKLLLTNKTYSSDLKLDINVPLIDIEDERNYDFDCGNLKTKILSENLIYIIYTSGSTGIPKGVMITHKNVVRLMKNDDFLFDFNSKDVWTMFHSVAFDFSVWEMYGALLYGGKLVLVPENTAKDVNEFLKLLRDEKVTVLNQTPTYFYNLLDNEIKKEDSELRIRYIIFGGEALKPNLIKKWKEKYETTKLINMYGITETTVHVTFKELNETDLLVEKSNIGIPISTLKVYILDEELKILPLGQEGEICVAGDGVARGYLNRPELNEYKFIESPFKEGEILYRSGDSGIIEDDGNLYYKGRIDTQVKIRGFRIELGEIETKLLTHPNILKCVVLSEKKSDKDAHLVAYIVCEKEIKILELKNYLKPLLPDYMIPTYFVKLDEIPINNNGKVDRKLLQTFSYTIERNTKYEKPRNDFEESLVQILEEEFNLEQIGIDDDIIELGADSLTLMRVVAKLLEKDYEISIQKIYENRTIRKISDAIKNENQNVEELEENLYFKFEEKNPKDKIELKNILLTGATGFLGIHILNDLIDKTKANIYCLIRNKDKYLEKDRLIKKLKFYFGDKLTKFIDHRIFIIKGDISLSKFGLTDEEYTKLGYKIDSVIHSAAIVSHYGENELFEKINVIGTNNIVEFCKVFNTKLNYISTISVSADYITNKKIKEEFNEHSLYIGQPYDKNIYVKTKFKAEYIIWKALNNNEIEATIYRLGNITARKSDGKFQENDSQNAFLNRILAILKIGKITEEILEYQFDLSPVDVCSDFITELIHYESSYNRVIHILNENTVTLREIIEAVNYKNIEIISKEEFSKTIKLSKYNMGLINDITNKTILTPGKISINSKSSINYMNKLNLNWMPIDKKYIKKVINKYLK